jgi:hypothetical protein
MPNTLLIISDMQFDHCARYDDSAMSSIERQYAEAGYDRPNIVFWNVNAGPGVPVDFKKKGAALVSGFSPAIMRSILNAGDEFTPIALVKKAVERERYDW